MDFSVFLGRLGHPDEAALEGECSISQVLSLPLEFIVFCVRNRREAELLLKVSKSAASLDLFMKSYEMIALRAKGLQEAWKGLWLAQEPYTVPAIPLIGLEMSGINSGRALLLEKMEREIIRLQEHGKQLGHYIDVNSSLVEELRMEGIERLAMNKLLLVKVERELARRIAHVCSSKSVRDLSPMRQFLCTLQKVTSPTSMTVAENNQSRDHTSVTNGSCSTEKVTTEGSSDAHRSMDNVREHTDNVSPDSQSIASKCAATQADNMHPPSVARSSKMLDYKQFPFELFGASSKGAPNGLSRALEIRLDVRNHSSSASEERLPKVPSARNGHGELFPVLTGDTMKSQELSLDRSMEGADECSKLTKKDLVGQGNFPLRSVNDAFEMGSKLAMKSQELSLDKSMEEAEECSKLTKKELVGQGNFPLRSVNDAFEMVSKLALTQEQACTARGEASNSNVATPCCPSVLAQASTAQVSMDQSLQKNQLDKIPDNAFKSMDPDSKHNNKRRHLELVRPDDDAGGENNVHLAARSSKRVVLETPDFTSAIKCPRICSSKWFQPGSSDCIVSSSFFDPVLDKEIAADSENKASLLPLCSCERLGNESLDTFSPMEFKAFFQDRCRDCGCFVSQAFTKHKRDVSDIQAGFHVEASHEQELADDIDKLTGCPKPATQ